MSTANVKPYSTRTWCGSPTRCQYQFPSLHYPQWYFPASSSRFSYLLVQGNGPLYAKTLATNATHFKGVIELDVHNLWGFMEEKTTHMALQTIQRGKRPFLISRSTFASAGKWTGHWVCPDFSAEIKFDLDVTQLGDNYSLWSYMKHNIQGVLQFQIFQIPFVGADTCGFSTFKFPYLFVLYNGSV